MNTLARYFAIREIPTRTSAKGEPSHLTSTEKLVLFAINAHAAEDATCFPSLDLLGRVTGLHRATVHAAVKRLAQLQHIALESSRGRTSNRYRVTVAPDERSTVVLDDRCPSNGRPRRTQPSRATTPTVVQDDTKRIKKKNSEEDLHPPRSAKGGTQDKPRHPDHASTVACWFESFEGARGVKPTFGAREGKLVTELLEKLQTGEEARAVIGKAFADRWWVQNQCNLQSLVSNPDKWRGHAPGDGRLQPLPSERPAWLAAGAE